MNKKTRRLCNRLKATLQTARVKKYGADEHVALVRQRDAWARWLRGFHWSYFATPTFRLPVSEQAARQAVAQWLAPLGPKVYAAVAVERGRVEGRIHAHVLLGGLPRRQGADVALRLGWGGRGRIAIEPYRGRGGAARYLCKQPDAVDLLGTPQLYRPRHRRGYDSRDNSIAAGRHQTITSRLPV